MSIVYISENGLKLGVESNQLTIKDENRVLQKIGMETVSGITLLGKSQLTTQCVERCLKDGIPVTYMSKGGTYFGRMMSTGHVKVGLQRRQAELYHTSFAVELSKRIIAAKIQNQVTVLRRYARNRDVDVSKQIEEIMRYKKKVDGCGEISQILGYEGGVARRYFQGLSTCINEEFRFKGRSRRPPKDEFNSLISMGYAILLNEIYCEIEGCGLHPYFGFMHQDAEKHPTLASDLMEEWRAVLIDSLAMSLINGKTLKKEDFREDAESKGCFLEWSARKIFLSKLEERFSVKMNYLSYLKTEVTFREAMSKQIEQLARAIEEGDATLYEPVRIR